MWVKNNNLAKTIFNCFILVIALVSTASAQFEGKVVVEWLQHDGNDRDVKLIEPFAFTDAAGKKWSVPKGAVVNGASIPSILWTSVGAPFVGDYRYASVIHDYYCDTKEETWKKTHRVFYAAMISSGVSKMRAKLMYGAVYAGGPRWEKITKKGIGGAKSFFIEQVSPGISQAQYDALSQHINKNNLSLEEIQLMIDEKSY